MNTPFITASNICIRIREKFLFDGDSWTMNKGEHWAILGPNGSGKSTLAKALAGRLPIVKGSILLHFGNPSDHPYPVSQKSHIGYLSFDTHRKVAQQEEKQAEYMSFAGREYEGKRVAEFIQNDEVIKTLGIEELSSKSLSHVSTGEMRKVLIAKFFSQNLKLLILDEPFEGVDAESKKSLIEFIDTLEHQK